MPTVAHLFNLFLPINFNSTQCFYCSSKFIQTKFNDIEHFSTSLTFLVLYVFLTFGLFDILKFSLIDHPSIYFWSFFFSLLLIFVIYQRFLNCFHSRPYIIIGWLNSNFVFLSLFQCFIKNVTNIRFKSNMRRSVR